MSRSRFLRRRFLNKRGFHAGAYVLAECQIEPTAPEVDPRSARVWAYVTFADCSRVATLDFNVTTEAEARNALHKIKLVRDTVEDFAEALEGAITAWRGEQV